MSYLRAWWLALRRRFNLSLTSVVWKVSVRDGVRLLEFSYGRPWWAVWLPRHVAFALSRKECRALGTALLHGERGDGE